jgi:hypothetical protein
VINISAQTSYKKLVYKVSLAFSLELLGVKKFRLYAMPLYSDELNEKTRITEDNCQDILRRFLEDDPFLQIYVCNGDSSPTTTPIKSQSHKITSSELPDLTSSFGNASINATTRVKSMSDTTSKSGTAYLRNPYNAEQCKIRDNFTCSICSLRSSKQFTIIEAAHIYDLESFHCFDGDKEQLLRELELEAISDVKNLVTLCKMCHSHFDEHYIGISKDLKNWVYQAEFLATFPNYFDYSTEIKFLEPKPSLAILKFRSEEYYNFDRVDSPSECLGNLFNLLVKNKNVRFCIFYDSLLFYFSYVKTI